MMTSYMEFSKTIHKKDIVFQINKKVLDDSLLAKIICESQSNKKIGLDMKNIQTINSDLFIEYLHQEKFQLYNLQSEVLVYLSIVLKRGFLKSYMNYRDFSSNKRQLFKRRLQLV